MVNSLKSFQLIKLREKKENPVSSPTPILTVLFVIEGTGNIWKNEIH